MRPDYCRQSDYRPRSRTNCHQSQRMTTFPTTTLRAPRMSAARLHSHNPDVP
ncbi:hypothetical protein IEO21_03904 [Rhodonia placenta]|uniref:Uncharacterized protein n=1 Tax=Rhodonia placenta TaxID=104341 RepID=A0A8H7P5A8_9APHY|nr:hypothetical protein IEO21_03904 [Postia placenta]